MQLLVRLKKSNELKKVEMKEFKCDTRSHRNFLYGKKQFMFTVLYRRYNYY